MGRWKIQFCQAVSRAKILRLHRLRPAEAQVRLQAGEAVGREARALLQEHPDLVLPVDVVEREGDEAERLGGFGVERSCRSLRARGSSARLAEEAAGEAREPLLIG